MTDGFSKVKHGNLAWRILLELAGRDEAVALKDLCETLGLEPVAVRGKLTPLHLDHRVETDHGRQNPRWWITWEGQESLRRADGPPAERKHHWWARSRA